MAETGVSFLKRDSHCGDDDMECQCGCYGTVWVWGGITSKSSRGREPKTVLWKRHLAWVFGEKQPAGNFGESCTV